MNAGTVPCLNPQAHHVQTHIAGSDAAKACGRPSRVRSMIQSMHRGLGGVPRQATLSFPDATTLTFDDLQSFRSDALVHDGAFDHLAPLARTIIARIDNGDYGDEWFNKGSDRTERELAEHWLTEIKAPGFRQSPVFAAQEDVIRGMASQHHTFGSHRFNVASDARHAYNLMRNDPTMHRYTQELMLAAGDATSRSLSDIGHHTIRLYRGVRVGPYFTPGQLDAYTHLPLESWSLDSLGASHFGTHTIVAEVSLGSIWWVPDGFEGEVVASPVDRINPTRNGIKIIDVQEHSEE